MSILLKPARLDKDPAGREPVEMMVTNGRPARGPGEPIPPRPLRLSPAESAELVRVGYLGDAPAEPMRVAADPYEPAEVERRINEIATELAQEHGGCRSDFALGAWKADYRHLWSLYQAKLVELDRRSNEFWPDECPSVGWTPGDDEPALTGSRA